MPKIRCLFLTCIHLEDSFCSASRVEFNPDEGCLTFSQLGDAEENIWDNDASINNDDFAGW